LIDTLYDPIVGVQSLQPLQAYLQISYFPQLTCIAIEAYLERLILYKVQYFLLDEQGGKLIGGVRGDFADQNLVDENNINRGK
jgi:hypothetical protein